MKHPTILQNDPSETNSAPTLQDCTNASWNKTALNYVQEHFIGFLFSTTFASLATIALFYFTASPTTSTEIRNGLEDVLMGDLKARITEPIIKLTFNSVITVPLALATSDSIFVYGAFRTGSTVQPPNLHTWASSHNPEHHRFLAVFERTRPGILDALVGRSGFYSLVHLSHIAILNESDLRATSVETEDLDLDGNAEILIQVKTQWADSSSIGQIILKKEVGESWRFHSFPPLSGKLTDILEGKLPHPAKLEPILPPQTWFADYDSQNTQHDFDKLREAYGDYSLFEDEWKVILDDGQSTFITLRNGGFFGRFRHPLKGYTQWGLAAAANDGRSTLAAHNVVIMFFSLRDQLIDTDLLWNWGFPMLSIAPKNISSIDLSEFHNAGIQSHITDIGVFFGYSDFENVTPPAGHAGN